MQHGFSFAFRAIHRLNFFRRHPVAEIEGIIGADHDVVGADHAFQVLDGFDAINEIVEVEVLQIFARRQFGGNPRTILNAPVIPWSNRPK